jgi:hypothetical protein
MGASHGHTSQLLRPVFHPFAIFAFHCGSQGCDWQKPLKIMGSAPEICDHMRCRAAEAFLSGIWGRP